MGEILERLKAMDCVELRSRLEKALGKERGKINGVQPAPAIIFFIQGRQVAC